MVNDAKALNPRSFGNSKEEDAEGKFITISIGISIMMTK